MSLPFPSEAWFLEYGEPIDESEAYAESVSDELPDDLTAEIARYIEDDTGYGFLGGEAGPCTGAEFVEHADSAVESAGVGVTATYDVWSLVAGPPKPAHERGEGF